MKKNLLKLRNRIDEFLEKIARASRENYVLWSIERSRKYREFRQEFFVAFVKQVSQFLRNREVWRKINERIGKQEKPVWTDRDTEELKEIIEDEFESLEEYFGKNLMEFYFYLANRGGQAFLDKAARKRLGKEEEIGVFVVFNLKDEELIRWLNERRQLLIRTVDDTTKGWLLRQLVKGKEEGLSNYEIADRIRERIPETFKGRAEAIVRTEMAEVVNNMEFEAAKRNGVQHKTWRAAGMNICPVCQANDGLTVGINGTFPSGHQKPPVHPYCKCWLDYDIPPAFRPYWTGE